MNAIIYNINVAINHIVLADANALFSEGQEKIDTFVLETTNTITPAHNVTQVNLYNTLINKSVVSCTVSTNTVSPVFSSDMPNDPTTIIIQSSELAATEVTTSAGLYDSVGDIIFQSIIATNRDNVGPTIVFVSKSYVNSWPLTKIITTNIYYLELKKA